MGGGLVWFGLVWFGRHPAHGPTVSRGLKAQGMGHKEALSPELPLSPGNRQRMESAHVPRFAPSPGVWYAPGIEPAISRLLFSCPTAGRTIPSGGRSGAEVGEGAEGILEGAGGAELCGARDGALPFRARLACLFRRSILRSDVCAGGGGGGFSGPLPRHALTPPPSAPGP